MLERITLKFTESNKSLKIDAQGVTIFVGPNNSGKSLVLRELEQAISTHRTPPTKILDDFELTWPAERELQADMASLSKNGPPGMVIDNIYVGRFNLAGNLEAQEVSKTNLKNQFNAREKKWVASQFYKYFLIRLDGRSRFDLTNERPTGDLLARPQNMLAHLFQDESAREEIRTAVFDAFGLYFVIDPTNGAQLRIRLSPTPPTEDEQSLSKAARDFHSQALNIKESSDGVQAFVGILTAVRSGDYRAFLIDEPEAFLHPPLARRLGHELATIVTKKGGALLASTHSPDFLIGCLQASQNIRVVRLEYSNGKSNGHIVDSAALNRFFKTPLVRSANVISALFHDGVVVTESDNDRAFYSEIYYRLAEREKGYPSLLFVNAQNKQTIRDIVEPLREFGVPAAAIVDIDILKDGGTTWGGWMEAARLPEATRNGLGQTRGDLRKRFEDIGVDMKASGVNGLSPEDQNAANDLFDGLAQYGIFVTRRGELEKWLPNLAVAGKKTDWTIAMLERLGSDPREPDYVVPGDNDVWSFIRIIVNWVKDTSRKGTV